MNVKHNGKHKNVKSNIPGGNESTYSTSTC